MLDPTNADLWAQKIAALVRGVENRVILEIARSVSADQGAYWWDTNKLAQLASLRARILEQLSESWEEVLDQAQKVLDQAADAGQGMARGDLREYHDASTIPSLATAQVRESIGQIAADTLKALTSLPALVLRDAADVYQQVMSLPVTEVALGAVTRRQATQDALNDFAARGFDSFTDKSGRRWRIDSYAEMATRTGAARAMRLGYAHTLTSAGIDLVHVTGHGYTCDKCAPWEGKILSLTGMTPVGRNRVQSVVDDRRLTITVHGTIEQATTEGLFHPNCLHAFSAYLPGATRPVATTGGDQKTYKASQEQRALEWEIRAEKRKLAASLSSEEATEHRSNIRTYQAQIRSLIADHPKLKRKPERETNYKTSGPRTTAAPKSTKPDGIPAKPPALNSFSPGISGIRNQSFQRF